MYYMIRRFESAQQYSSNVVHCDNFCSRLKDTPDKDIIPYDSMEKIRKSDSTPETVRRCYFCCDK